MKALQKSTDFKNNLYSFGIDSIEQINSVTVSNNMTSSRVKQKEKNYFISDSKHDI
jgi:hypothetical protein